MTLEAQQCEPVRVRPTGQQFGRALAHATRAAAAQERAMVEEELQQAQAALAQAAALEEVLAQPRVQGLHRRARAWRVVHGPADFGHDIPEAGANRGVQVVPARQVRVRAQLLV